LEKNGGKLPEHEQSESHHSRLFLIGGIQSVTTVTCYNCPWSPLRWIFLT